MGNPTFFWDEAPFERKLLGYGNFFLYSFPLILPIRYYSKSIYRYLAYFFILAGVVYAHVAAFVKHLTAKKRRTHKERAEV
jgi:hypothetical protein